MFQITKDSKLPYKYYPKDKFELRKILEERLAKDKNADLNDIDVSQITDMSNTFTALDPYNINMEFWDVSKVNDMYDMFYGCEHFDADLGNWDVSNVKDMKQMFVGCKYFRGDGLEYWNPKKCMDMEYMFSWSAITKRPTWYVNWYNGINIRI